MYELKAGLQQAVKFLSRDKKAPWEHKAVRLFAKTMTTTGRAYVFDGKTGIIVYFHPFYEIPDALLPGDMITDLVRHASEVSAFQPEGNARFLVRGVSNKKAALEDFYIQGKAPSEFPIAAQFPTEWEAIPTRPYNVWGEILRLVHLTGKDKTKPELSAVRFRAGAVEATDMARVGRVQTVTRGDALVPVEVLKNWPKDYDGVSLSFADDQLVFFRCDREIRFGYKRPMEHYPQLDTIIPEYHDGWAGLISTPALLDAVKAATAVSGKGIVNLRFGPLGVHVDALFPREMTHGFYALVDGCADARTARQPLEGNSFSFNGKLLSEALKEIKTPRVRMCYRYPQEPLRIESGLMIECLWPMELTEEEKQNVSLRSY